jgi:hypothetical protein
MLASLRMLAGSRNHVEKECCNVYVLGFAQPYLENVVGWCWRGQVVSRYHLHEITCLPALERCAELVCPCFTSLLFNAGYVTHLFGIV